MTEKLIEILQMRQAENIMIYEEKREMTAANSSLSSLFAVYDFELQKLENGLQIDVFVIAGQMIAHQAEFNKIMDYCSRTGAGIYDVKGRDLYRICRDAGEKGWCSYEELFDEIEKHNYISFDIFDTLLMRRVMLPEDVFDLVQRNSSEKGMVIENFREKRIKAQEQLGLSNPNLYEIYNCLQNTFHIAANLADAYLEEEIAVEKQVLVPRKEMLQIYKRCLEMGKKVFLVTDMYISENTLKEILEENGITGYEKLYLSCTRKQLKLQGLLETYKAEAGNNTFLHIGDHLIHDGICACLAGIDYCLIPAGYKYALLSPLKKAIQKAASLEEHVVMGMVINRMFNNPFTRLVAGNRETKSLVINSEKDYAYIFCAAYVARFALWIFGQAKKSHYKGVLFAARDGYLMKQMYDWLKDWYGAENLPESIYFYTSRKAAVMPCVKDEQYINMIIGIYEGKEKEEMMREGFALTEEQIFPYQAEEYDPWQLYVWKHVDAIMDRAEEARKNYMKYMGNLRLAIGWKYAFMDFVSSGTCQKSLVKYAPFDIEGLYAGWKKDADGNTICVRTMVEDKDSYFIRHYKGFETFLTSGEPSVDYFDEGGNPVFGKEKRTREELNYIEAMQNGCMDFFKEFISLTGSAEAENLQISLLDSLLAASEESILSDAGSVLHHLCLVDDWSNQRDSI
ncbi:MAG: hypothetical protein J6C64_14840 [Lachnospiraceae bacterium]|nr:hypothetical protein [Lachnospiraceae bacterium]